ncbi:MAG TPA: translesion DNA synthesis-associated protein ImuA [Usitatibacter sp.]|jgi:cell division inhibitor SulA/protein ImuA|nr:translesion DNA synthesis-associated protein ImuA [Usitatibacter sp.]
MKATVAELAKLPGVWRGGELEHASQPSVPTGHAALDRELPGGGWPSGTLTEVLHDGAGIGEVSFLAGALARASEGGRLIAWINAPHLPYAPALGHSGLPLECCLVIRPANKEDALWAAEQVLRSGACGAALLWLAQDDYAWLRRLQMAAQAGRALAVLYRGSAALRLSTPAHLRVLLERDGGWLQVRIPKRRGPPLEQPITLQVGKRSIRKDKNLLEFAPRLRVVA